MNLFVFQALSDLAIYSHYYFDSPKAVDIFSLVAPNGPAD